MSVHERLQGVFRDIFNDPGLIISDPMSARDVEGWDSLAHISLMFSIESEFGVAFDDDELSSLRNVGDLRRSLEEKVAS